MKIKIVKRPAACLDAGLIRVNIPSGLMDREEAWELVKAHVANKNLRKHMLAAEVVMMHPSRKLKHLDQKFLIRRFGEKRFAAGANRGQIRSCEELGLSVDEFLKLALTAMQAIDKDLGL